MTLAEEFARRTYGLLYNRSEIDWQDDVFNEDLLQHVPDSAVAQEQGREPTWPNSRSPS